MQDIKNGNDRIEQGLSQAEDSRARIQAVSQEVATLRHAFTDLEGQLTSVGAEMRSLTTGGEALSGISAKAVDTPTRMNERLEELGSVAENLQSAAEELRLATA